MTEPVKDYTGDVSPTETWSILKDNPKAVLVDVRTDAEFCYVGLPDLSPLPNRYVQISWALFPDMVRNPHFEDAVRDVAPEKDTPLLFICRSGVRSIAAANTMAHIGYVKTFNVLEGFEGDKDVDGHRGKVGGWKVAGLPWIQG